MMANPKASPKLTPVTHRQKAPMCGVQQPLSSPPVLGMSSSYLVPVVTLGVGLGWAPSQRRSVGWSPPTGTDSPGSKDSLGSCEEALGVLGWAVRGQIEKECSLPGGKPHRLG